MFKRQILECKWFSEWSAMVLLRQQILGVVLLATQHHLGKLTRGTKQDIPHSTSDMVYLLHSIAEQGYFC